jgi:hypothetical protein
MVTSATAIIDELSGWSSEPVPTPTLIRYGTGRVRVVTEEAIGSSSTPPGRRGAGHGWADAPGKATTSPSGSRRIAAGLATQASAESSGAATSSSVQSR